MITLIIDLPNNIRFRTRTYKGNVTAIELFKHGKSIKRYPLEKARHYTKKDGDNETIVEAMISAIIDIELDTEYVEGVWTKGG